MTEYENLPAPERPEMTADLDWGYHPGSLVLRPMGWDEGFDEERRDDLGQEYGVLIDDRGEVCLEDWHLHRVGGPSFRSDINGNREEEWRVNQMLDREDGPAQIVEVEGQVYAYIWAQNDELHRAAGGGPAVDYDDQISGEAWAEWWVRGKRHRVAGPAVVYSGHGLTAYEWWVDGECRRKVVLETDSDEMK